MMSLGTGSLLERQLVQSPRGQGRITLLAGRTAPAFNNEMIGFSHQIRGNRRKIPLFGSNFKFRPLGESQLSPLKPTKVLGPESATARLLPGRKLPCWKVRAGERSLSASRLFAAACVMLLCSAAAALPARLIETN